MSNISTWSTTAASNNSASPNGFPEGMAPSGVNDSARENMAAIRTFYNNIEWRDWGHTPTRTGNTTFTVPTDVTAIYTANRRIKCTDSSTLYGTISSSVFGAVTTVTVTLDSGNLSASLTAVAVGLDVTNTPIHASGVKDALTVSGGTLTGASPLVFEGSTADAFETTLTITDPTADRTITLPNATGTVQLNTTAGNIVQIVNTQTGAVASGANAMPHDDTIPQNSEGIEFITLAVTPQSATNKLLIEAQLLVSASSVERVGVALFQDSTVNAIAAISEYVSTATAQHLLVIRHYMTSGTVSATTFKIRIGTPTGATITLNGESGSRLFGGVGASSITITEIAV